MTIPENSVDYAIPHKKLIVFSSQLCSYIVVRSLSNKNVSLQVCPAQRLDFFVTTQ